MINDDNRSWAINAHAAGLLVFTNIPFANVIATLLVWLRVRHASTMEFARAHAVQSFNFQATYSLLVLLLAMLYVGLLTVLPDRLAIASYFPMALAGYIALVVANIALTIAGTLAASDMRSFRYPLAIGFIH